MSNKISIGIPTYNQGKYIEETILSCLNQTVKPYEIVVSNNHCTDETDSILEKYKDKIKIVKPPHFLTMTENYQFLLDNLSGDWYMHIDSDDLLEPNAVEEVIKYTDDKDVVLIRYGVNLIDEAGNVIKKGHPLRSTWKRCAFPHNFYEQLSHSITPSPGRTIKIQTLRESGGFNTQIKIAGDWYTFLQLSPYGIFLNTGKVLSNYRTFPTNKKGVERVDNETNDHSIIVRLEKELCDRYSLSEKTLKLAKIAIARRRYMFHKSLNHPFDFSKFGVTEDEILSFGKWDKFILMIRETILKR